MKKSDEILNPAYCKIAYQPSTYESKVLILDNKLIKKSLVAILSFDMLVKLYINMDMAGESKERGK